MLSSGSTKEQPRRRCRKVRGVPLGPPYLLITVALAVNWIGDVMGWWG